MSEDEQKPPESLNSQPETPPTPVVVEPSVKRLESQPKPPLFKAVSIKALRGTIGLLEGIVEKLEAEPVREIPSAAVPRTMTPVSTPILDTTTATSETEWLNEAEDVPSIAPTPAARTSTPEDVPQPVKPSLLDRILPSFRSLEAFWDATLAKIRSLLPAAWNEKLSDWMLTGAIAGSIVVILVTTAAILPDTPAQVAKAPPNTIEAPPELKAPKPPQPVEVETPPPPELTPEQSLIAAIQNQVAEITNQYENGLIQSIEANFEGSRLIVKVSDGWYNLKESQQNKLADEILSRSNDLDFSKLQITDLKGTLIARSPVVGTKMVILKRQELAANL